MRRGRPWDMSGVERQLVRGGQHRTPGGLPLASPQVACASRPLTSSRRPGSTVLEEGRFDNVRCTYCPVRCGSHVRMYRRQTLLYAVASANGSVSIAVLVAEAGPCDAVQPAVNYVAG